MIRRHDYLRMMKKNEVKYLIAYDEGIFAFENAIVFDWAITTHDCDALKDYDKMTPFIKVTKIDDGYDASCFEFDFEHNKQIESYALYESVERDVSEFTDDPDYLVVQHDSTEILTLLVEGVSDEEKIVELEEKIEEALASEEYELVPDLKKEVAELKRKVKVKK